MLQNVSFDAHKAHVTVIQKEFGTAGAAIAIEAGDVTLFTTDLRCLASILRLGRRSRSKILQNISLSVLTKVLLLQAGDL